MNACGIYKITNPKGRIYIGQTINFNSRKKYYKTSIKKDQLLLYNSIKKHGWENHTFEVLEVCTREKLSELEIYYIKKFNSFNHPNGMNATMGGDSFGKITDEANNKRINSIKQTWSNPILRQKQRERALSTWTDEKRKAHADISKAIYTKEKRDEFSKMYTGDGNPFYGKKHGEETKKRISEKKRGTPSPFKDKKRPDSAGKNNVRSKQIDQFNLDGSFIKSYESLNIASIETGISRLTIRTSCNGSVKKPQKFIFKYGKS